MPSCLPHQTISRSTSKGPPSVSISRATCGRLGDWGRPLVRQVHARDAPLSPPGEGCAHRMQPIIVHRTSGARTVSVGFWRLQSAGRLHSGAGGQQRGGDQQRAARSMVGGFQMTPGRCHSGQPARRTKTPRLCLTRCLALGPGAPLKPARMRLAGALLELSRRDGSSQCTASRRPASPENSPLRRHDDGEN